MKIGILTYHRAENYGALLQAYALRTYIQNLGHEVSFVDYWPKYHEDFFRIFSWDRFICNGIRGRIDYLLGVTIWLCPRLIRKIKFQSFINKELGLKGKPLYNEKTISTEPFEVVIYGSDQIWRKQNMASVEFDDWYFGSGNVVADNRIVYAGSMGTVKTTLTDDEYLKTMMRNFNQIAVREEDLKNKLQSLGISSSLVIDPVFLLTKDQWMKIMAPGNTKQEKYILFYNLLNKHESVSFAERLSRETGLPIKELNKKMSLSHIGKRYISTASVEEFLRLIMDAEYVVSNSFHGVAFSIIFQKQFYAVGMGEKANRVKSLLNSVGIQERYVVDADSSILSLNSIDYQMVLNNLKMIVGDSILFLFNSFKK